MTASSENVGDVVDEKRTSVFNAAVAQLRGPTPAHLEQTFRHLQDTFSVTTVPADTGTVHRREGQT